LKSAKLGILHEVTPFLNPLTYIDMWFLEAIFRLMPILHVFTVKQRCLNPESLCVAVKLEVLGEYKALIAYNYCRILR